MKPGERAKPFPKAYTDEQWRLARSLYNNDKEKKHDHETDRNIRAAMRKDACFNDVAWND